MSYTLPAPCPDQAYFSVTFFEGRQVKVPLRYLLDPVPDGADKQLISVTKRNILFDLGVRKDYDNYPPALAQPVKDVFLPMDVSEDIVDSLAKGGLKLSDISTIFPSHIHWASLLPPGHTAFLKTSGADWKPIGPFLRALDYYGDGSLYVIDAPGHVQGHINLQCTRLRWGMDVPWRRFGP
ncbi:hypothetical protein EWM64_g3370 [Hericium alpestre]|uniref:Metallo-beta-lactamase domain-containing protein n=1 Tax=Hericium alpestre TaxID=135208 RepID=A0A4Z0A435_9AGAM|nr:hypothetical protein EWM64_g3370 [Hericium alpestre]